jgi:hypothetical protein
MRTWLFALTVSACTSAAAPDSAPAAPTSTLPPTIAVADATAAPDTTPADPREGTPSAEVLARLVTLPDVPHCGVLHIGALLEYELVDTFEGRIAGTRFFAVQSCPWRLPDDALPKAGGFRVGDLYRLRLTTDSKVAPDTMSLWPMTPMPLFYWTAAVEPV